MKTKNNSSASAHQNYLKKKNKIIPILSLVMVVNALGYGIMIPLLYPFASKFGLGPIGLGLLFASFSFFQFLATPVIGRLSDRYGRRPLLIFSLFGTSVSLAMIGLAPNVLILFLARILDGISGGNNSVAQAIIADVAEGEDRTKAFGMLGASFGIGFLLGPVLGGLLSTYGMHLPFMVASALAMAGTLLGWAILPETLAPQNRSTAAKEPLFDLYKLLTALALPTAGSLLLVTLLSSVAHSTFVLGFQSFTVDILKMTSTQIAFLFSGVGVVSIFVQAFGMKKVLSYFKDKYMILYICFLAIALITAGLYFPTHILSFSALALVYPLFFAPTNVLVPNLLADNTRREDQGGVMGLQQSYMAIGQIIGPLIAGLVGTYSVRAIFPTTGVLFLICLCALAFTSHRARKINI
jgi:multidrug resistance protein